MKEAILLLNMGGPNNLGEVELFLKNMFNDPYILTMKSSLLRRFIATMITFTRTEKSQDIYRQIGGKSPLVDHTKRLVDKLQSAVGEEIMVDFIMRYTPPMATEVCSRLQNAGVDKVYLIPLYPQYSTTTTQSSLDDFYSVAYRLGWNVVATEVKHFFEMTTYNLCLIKRINEALQGEDPAQYDIVFSAHGLPQKIVDAGDPYELHVTTHVNIMRKLLAQHGLHFRNIHQAYQSKVGPMKWLEPSLEESLRAIEGQNVLIVPIAFTIDNSETDFELSIEYAEVAEEIGFESYRVARCPNDHPLFVQSLQELFESMRLR
ncbi:MAG: ferrochelatase [Sulfuricurvum sp.]